MRVKAALLGFVLLTVLYIGALGWADARRHVFDGLLTLEIGRASCRERVSSPV